MFGLSAKERALKKYQDSQRKLRNDATFTCSASDPNFLLWYTVASSQSVSQGVDQSCSADAGNSYSSGCDTSSSSGFDSGSSW